MGIPVTIFPSSTLPHHLNTDVRTGRRRKTPLDLSRCALLEMQQWDCQIVDQVIQCRSIDRLFRRCKDAASGKNITVEVTGVEAPPWRDDAAVDAS